MKKKKYQVQAVFESEGNTDTCMYKEVIKYNLILQHHTVRNRKVLTVTGDHSFKHGCFPIEIQYLTTVLGRILFSSVVMVLAFGVQGHWFKSCSNLIYLPCIYSFVSLLRTLFIR